MNYIIITPVRNEQEHLPKTIASVVAQTLRPLRWIIVNDGSADQTPAIVDRAAREHPWIKAVHREDRGFRKPGGGVIEAFYDAYSKLDLSDWEYLVKLDGDLEFSPDYFQRCFQHFDSDPRLGIGGGTICRSVGTQLLIDSSGDPQFHVRGATKIYRGACWNQLGGLFRGPGWDTIDELKANMLGWRTYTFPELLLHQLKDTGSADGAWYNWVKNGRANYITGYHPGFMFAKCIKRVFSKPFLIAASGLAWGFVSGYLRRTGQIDDPALIKYVRQQQMNYLTLQDSLWRQTNESSS